MQKNLKRGRGGQLTFILRSYLRHCCYLTLLDKYLIIYIEFIIRTSLFLTNYASELIVRGENRKKIEGKNHRFTFFTHRFRGDKSRYKLLSLYGTLHFFSLPLFVCLFFFFFLIFLFLKTDLIRRKRFKRTQINSINTLLKGGTSSTQ